MKITKHGIDLEIDAREAAVLRNARMTLGRIDSPCMMQAIADVKFVWPEARIVEVRRG